MDGRHRFIVTKLCETYSLPPTIVEAAVKKHHQEMSRFFEADGPQTLTWYYQVPAAQRGAPGAEPVLFLSDVETEGLSGKALSFSKASARAVQERSVEADVAALEIVPQLLSSLRALITDLYIPAVESQDLQRRASSAREEFLQGATKLAAALSEASSCAAAAVQLRPPDAKAMAATEGRLDAKAFAKLAADRELVAQFTAVLEEWCSTVQELLDMGLGAGPELDGAGPEVEVELWRTRMTRLNSVTEQLQGPAYRATLGVCAAAKAPAYPRWKELELSLTDVAVESRGTVKYLSTLEGSLECLYTKSPEQIQEALPVILGNLKMVHAISRHYSQPAEMGRFLRRVANQLAARSRAVLAAGGKLWEQPKPQLINCMGAVGRLHAAFVAQAAAFFAETLPADAPQPDLPALFTAYDQFAKRCRKLGDMFATVHQFSQLGAHSHIEGIDAIMAKFSVVLDDIKKKPYDLLDATRNEFDRDLLEFDVNINDLEVALLGVMNACFDRSASTEQSLLLLRQFEELLQRESFRADLEAKYAAAFQSYSADLEHIQELYEKHKGTPPLPRNAPPVAGKIMWARHLLQRIEGPMARFKLRPSLMEAKDSKRAIRTFNRLAQTLLEYQHLWHGAWLRSVEASKAQLQATLLAEHLQTGKLLVNFDKDILTLLREARHMRGLGLAVPEAAAVVAMQDGKLKGYYNDLTHALKELDRISAAVKPTLRPLLRPHLIDLDDKIRPGQQVLTWTSMNIDGYIHMFHAAIARTEELVRKATDILENRIEANLVAIAKSTLVDLPKDSTFAYDEFVAAQSRYIKKQTEGLVIRNQEVQRACEELLDMVATWPRENTECRLGGGECDAFRQHCSQAMYQAVLSAVKTTFAALKQRLSSKAVGGVFVLERPIFSVDLLLRVPAVVVNPSVDEIQATINATAKKVLQCTKHLRMWGGSGGGASASSSSAVPEASYYNLIAKDPDVVKVVLLLTGSLEGMKQATAEYLGTFDGYQFLWRSDMQQEYEAFMATRPSLEEFELQLRRFMDLEQEINALTPVHNIGALSLDTQPLKASLRSEAASWKAQFAKNLHKKGSDDLKAFDQYLRDVTAKLNRKVEDLDDVRFVMGVLREVRETEARIDSLITPIDDMYSLLLRYEVRVPKEETDMVGDLRYSWRKLKKLALDVSDNLSQLQVGFKKTLLQDVKAFVVDAVDFRQDWEANGPTVPGLDPTDASDRLRKFQQLFEVRKRKWVSYSSGEELFGLPITQYPELERTEEEITMLDKVYSLYVNVISTIRGYGDLLWVDVVERLDGMAAQVNEFQAQCKKLPKALRDWPAYKDCRKVIEDFLELLPLFQALAHKSIRERHWKELMQITGRELNLAEDVLKLRHLLSGPGEAAAKDVLNAGGLLKHKDDLEDLCNAAVKEEIIELKLKKLGEEWASEVFTFAEHKNRGPVILKPSDTSELMERLEDSLLQLGSMATNRYAAPFRPEVTGWVARLSTVSEVIDHWLLVQNMWMYMEAVFSGGDIVKQLPAEAKRFQNIDKNFMKVVLHASETRNVVATCVGTELLKSMLPHLLEQLELCQKSLSAYLETKRSEFPRFYFVSDPTLLEILSLGSDPPSVVPHFQSGLFDSLSNVTFDKVDKTKMLEMFSREGERVRFETPVEAKGNIEVWLQRLVDGMQGTMKSIIKGAVREVYEQELEQFIFSHPAQVALLGLQFQWTADMQAALHASKTDKAALTKALKKADTILRDLVQITLRTDLTKIQRTNLETCITVHMHQKESTEELVRKKVRDPSDFEWLKQCRFYWRDDLDTAIISICDVDLEYSWEYLGVKERLVITPLTDVCYVTLSQALGMFLGGAPAGPAGTGKTETTKDLGATLGKYVVVFNCSDQMDYKGMGKIYKGLAQSGLWGCFDEFNRINLDVLSVCAQQIYCVLSAIRERKKSFVFTDGSTVSLDPRVGYFITMNPGYAGRQELPENLKALFRGVTMMVPNRQIIIKVKLAACGYQENDILSKKFFVLYGLCEQQLSKQAHYDFGLRNILSVLRMAGASKRASPDKSEVFLMMRTLRDLNMSKFVAEDVPLFLSLVDDLFPGMKAERAQFPDVTKALEKVVAERGLQAHPSWMNKCIQLYETYLVRHGIMVVGPAGAGKSAIIDCLAAALSELGTKHVIWRMNPKAITAPQMFGRMDAATGDWTDGVFAVLWRRAAKAKNQTTLLVLDGPVDAIWIENLNTVLDDNKVLTLANGDRILMTPHMKAMFEPENLNNASPATVSRAGIIYVSDSELGWQPVVASWLAARPEREAAALRPCFDKFVGPLFDFIRLNCKPVMHNESVCQVSTLLTLLTGVLKPLTGEGAGSGSGGSAAAAAALAPDHYERLFIYCLAWSLGGLLDARDRVAFDAQLRTLTSQAPKKVEGETVYEYLVNEQTGQWQHWRERIPAWEYPAAVARPKFTQLVIPTLDSVRYERLLALVHSVGKSSLLVGGPGTAKTSTIQQFLGRFSRDECTNKTITFSYLTTPLIFQRAIEGAVEKRQGRTYGPPGGKAMTVFIDDLSLPSINEWGDQVTNELVRQLLDTGGFYSLEKPIGDMKMVVDTSYVAAMNAPGGGKSDIPNRLKRQFCIFNVPPPAAASIDSIFGTLMAGRFSPEVFSAEVSEAARKLVPLTMQLFNKVQAKMLPTPSKFHYSFTLRDLSKAFQGVLLAERECLTGVGHLLALWVHECQRVFADKLVSLEDRAFVHNTTLDLAKQAFGSDLVQQVSREEPVFVDFLRDPKVDENTGEVMEARPRVYEMVPGGLEATRRRVESFMAHYNEESKIHKLDLVLFKDALEHLVRISRLLAMERGSALLVGVGGSGKQSLARLAAYIAGAYTFQITVTKTYSITNLLEDLKGLYKVAGVKGQPVAFIFTDAEVKDDSWLEVINQLLMTGEVVGLFAKDELDAILNDVRPLLKAECPGVPDTWDNLYSFFLNRVRDRLHVILCFSPVGPRFARWAQQFPGLINGCTIDWYLPWPEEALMEVSSKFLDSFCALECTTEVRSALKRMMASVHVQVTAACKEYHEKYRRSVHVTPKSYLSFINGFKALYSRKLTANRELAASINSGLQKMFEAKADVNRMKGELAVKNQELAVAAKEAEKLLHEISESTAVAEKEKQKVAVIVEAVTKKAEEIAAVKSDAEHDLAEAKPALEAAVAALNSISPKDITALKALKNPPDVIKRIFDCVLLLRHFPVNKVAWQDVKGAQVIAGTYEEAVKMMGDLNFLNMLVNFPKEQINDETVELLQPYFAAPDFNYDSAKKASGNVAGLCNWAEAMCKYHTIAKVVEPKIEKLREAEAELKVATKERQEVEEELAVVQAKLDEMQAQFDAAMAQKQALEDDAAATQRLLEAANQLISALAGEEARWTEQSKMFDEVIARLVGDCATASSFVSYLGPFNKEFREVLLQRDFYGACVKLGLPTTKDFKVSSFLADDAEVGEWNLQGLPTDDLSIQNGILVTRATRYPVLVDPQGQGRAWLLNREAANGLVVTQLGDKHFRNHLEEAMSFGKPLLIENIEEEVDPVLFPVLEKRYVKRGKSVLCVLPDKEVDVSEGFQLYMATRLPKPKFSPELHAMVLVVDFTVTMTGLEDQLLGKLILKEKSELEMQKQRLLEEVQAYKKKIKQLEDDLLFRLSNSKGNLLDDTELIGILAVTKQTAHEVSERLITASETRLRITEACEEYRPVARRATLLYFQIAEFTGVNCMYQTSLNQFEELYLAAIDNSERAPVPAKRIHNIIDHLTYEVYLYIQRGLFERHKLAFAFQLAMKILVSAGQIKPEEFDAFLKGAGALDAAAVRKKPKEWIPEVVWMNVAALAQLDTFRDLPDSVTRSDAAWRAWYDAEAPECAPIPDFETRLTKFHRCCVVKAFREDRTLIAATDFIAEALGQRFVDSVPLNMERAWAESKPRCPLICLLSPGSDPTKLIEELAKKKKLKCLGVSMGQGQEVAARKYMAAAAAKGHWVLLQNTHLSLAYLAEVETFLAKTESLHENFRLWITAEPHPSFPIGLLQRSIKLTNEAPVGLKAGLRASYAWVSQDMLEAVNRFEWRQLLFTTCFLHSIVQERRKFGPIGFNVPYEFNQSDLSASVQFLQNHIMDMDAKKSTQPDWSTVRYMVATIQYGGRVTDDFDRLLLDTYAARFYHEEVLHKNYELYRDERNGFSYTVPDGTEIEVFRRTIEELPATEGPEIFGLHSNADIAFRTNQVQAAVQLILDTQPKGGVAAGGLSREEVADGIAEDLLPKCPSVFDGEEVRERLKKLPGGPTMPLTIHLRQEIDRVNRVITATLATLKNLRLAVAGTIALNEELQGVLDAVFNARVPAKLQKISWEASSLGTWFAGLLQRHDQLHRWLHNGRPKSYWLPGFFNPQGFLTAMKQEVTRRHASEKWALDDVVMVSEVTKLEPESVREPPGEGVYVHGLFLEGCAWSSKEGKLVDSEPKRLYSPLPVLHVSAVLAKDKKRSGFVEVPCYRVKRRTSLNYIEKLMLRCSEAGEDRSRWVLRGAALLCSTD